MLGMNLTNASRDLATGLFVRTAGICTSVMPTYFTINDGSTLGDVKVILGAPAGLTPGQFVEVKGIASLESYGRVILLVP